MTKSFQTFLFLLFILPIIVACSNGIEPNATAIPPTLAINEATTDTISTMSPDLTETYIGENLLVDATLTVNYPSGWTVRGLGTQLLLASVDPETIQNNSNAIVINIVPVEGEALADFEDRTPTGVVSQAMLNTTGQAVDVTSITFGDREVATANATFDGNSSLVYALQVNPDVFVILTAIKTQAFSDDETTLIRAIAEQIEYDAGAIPQSE